MGAVRTFVSGAVAQSDSVRQVPVLSKNTAVSIGPQFGVQTTTEFPPAAE